MIEITQKRDYNKKRFTLPDGKVLVRAHAGHIHYFNKLGVGDGQVRMRELDWSLVWDDAKRGWGFAFHSFQPFLPQFADEWVEFRDLFEGKDQTIRLRAVANHTQGRLVEAKNLEKEGLSRLTDVNCVVYDDAFGEGFDYILYFTRSTLRKVVRIREGFKPKDDISFDFETEFPGEFKRGYSKETIEYALDVSRGKLFDTDKQTLLGIDQSDGREWHTYFRPFLVWDKKHSEIAKVEYLIDNGKKILRKHVTQSFLESSEGDVFTDLTISYYVGSGDGNIFRILSTWDATHDATTGTANATNTTAAHETSTDGSTYYIERDFFPIDTSGLDDAGIVNSATFYFTVAALFYNTGSIQSVLVQTTQGSNTTLSSGDFNDCGAVNNPTEGATRITLASTGLKSFTLNATGLSWISKTGFTKLGIRTALDADDTAPVNSSTEIASQIYMSEQTGTGSDPYIEIGFTPAKQFTVDGIVKQIASKTFTIDGIVATRNTESFTVDGIVQAVGVKPFTVDGIVKATLIEDLTVDGIVLQVQSESFTIDGIVLLEQEQAFTVDGIVRATLTKTHTIDGIVKEIRTSAFTVDGIVKASGAETFTVDGIVITRVQFDVGGIVSGALSTDYWTVNFNVFETFTIDGIVKATFTEAFTVDGIVLEVQSEQFTVDGIVRATFTGGDGAQFTVDGIVLATQAEEFTVDGIVKATATKTFTVDGIILEQQDQSFTIDGIVLEVQGETFTIDGLVKATFEKTFTVDGIILEVQSESFTVDGIVKAVFSETFTIDGIVLEVQSEQFTIDGIVLEQQDQTFTIDGIVKAIFSEEFTIDGIVRQEQSELFSIDGIVKAIFSETFTIDGIVLQTDYETITIDGIVKAIVTEQFTVDGAVAQRNSNTFTIDGIILEEFTATFSIDGVVNEIGRLRLKRPRRYLYTRGKNIGRRGHRPISEKSSPVVYNRNINKLGG